MLKFNFFACLYQNDLCICTQITTNKKIEIMNLEIKKLQKEEVPVEHQTEQGCVAFQMVIFTFDFYGKKMESVLDTKIFADGRQIVKDGDGLIKAGYEIK
jgi:hypothetical protein